MTRQNLPTIDQQAEEAYAGVEKGAYTVSKAKTDSPAALLLATGSEVGLAIEAQAKLAEENIHVSVVSMPSWDRFEKQSAEYKNSVLPPNVTKRLAIEMGSSFGWGKFTGLEGDVLAIDRFGASAPGETIMKEYGFTAENVVDRVKKLLNK